MLFLESIGCVLTPVPSFPRPLSMPSQPHRRQWMGPLGSCGGMAEVLPRTLSQHLLGLLRLWEKSSLSSMGECSWVSGGGSRCLASSDPFLAEWRAGRGVLGAAVPC